jgi:hypothetical protein
MAVWRTAGAELGATGREIFIYEIAAERPL